MKPLIFIVCSLCIFPIACQRAKNEYPQPKYLNNSQDSKLTYLALGDSYTIGTAVKQEERWVVQLGKKITYKGKTGVTPDIIAQSGMTTADLLRAIAAKNLPNDYQLVSLQIGVNNQYRGQDISRFQDEFRQLLEFAIQFANGKPNRVFVLSIPDWDMTPFGTFLDRNKISAEIDAYNLIAKNECGLKKIAFVDITPVSRLAKSDKSLIASDELHYSGKMYQLWSDLALPIVEQLLKF